MLIFTTIRFFNFRIFVSYWGYTWYECLFNFIALITNNRFVVNFLYMILLQILIESNISIVNKWCVQFPMSFNFVSTFL
uniref:Uncharacterized protein n=1 Tax=Cryptosporidium parvum TaxID=5807 RepID=F0X532_CRYPV